MTPIVQPQQFSTSDGSIQGIIDGLNANFSMGVVLHKAEVFRNGQELTLNVDCTASNRFLVFYGSHIPQPGDIITVLGYPL